MSSFRVRPRFRHVINLDLETTQRRIVDHLTAAESRCEVKKFPGYICLRIPEPDRHFWSPRLTLSIESAGDGKSVIEGIYGPNATVWSLFLYGYLIVGTLGVFAACIGLVQVMIDHTPSGLWVLGLMLAAATALYVVAQFGQKLGAQQTFLLHQAYESAMGQSVEIR